jgi:hypothetical protein
VLAGMSFLTLGRSTFGTPRPRAVAAAVT